jgi:hypothetical protein
MNPSQFREFYKRGCSRLRSYPLHVAQLPTIYEQQSRKAFYRMATRAKFARALGVNSSSVYQRTLVDIILDTVGISPSDRPRELPVGSLDPLKAHNILSGAFRLDFTTEISRHLTFTEADGPPTLLLLRPEAMIPLFELQLAGFFRYLANFNINYSIAGIPTLFFECLNTYILFFDRYRASRKVADDLKIDMTIFQQYSQKYILVTGSSLEYDDFPIFANRLRYVLMRMEEWRPHNYRELSIQPYNDPMAYHAFWFSGYLAVFTILSLAIAIAQTYASFKAIP